MDQSAIKRFRAETPALLSGFHNTSRVGEMSRVNDIENRPTIHLNGLASPPPQSVIDAVKAHVELEARIHGGCGNERKAVARVDGTVLAAARLIRAPPTDVFLGRDPAQCIRSIIRALRLQPHNKVLYFGLPELTVRVASTEACMVEVPSTSEGIIDVSSLSLMIDSDVALIAVNHASFSGKILPLSEIENVVKAHGSLLLVDASTTIGQYDVDMSTSNIDFLVAKGSAFLRGPRGSAIAYIRPCKAVDKMVIHLDDSLVTLGTAYTFGVESESFGSHVGLGAAIDYYYACGPTLIRNRVCELAGALRAGLAGSCDILSVQAQPGADRCEAIVCFSHADPTMTTELHSYLTRTGFTVSLISGVAPAGSNEVPLHYIRVGLQYYNTNEEIQIFLNCCHEAVDQMKDHHEWVTLTMSDTESEKSSWDNVGLIDESFELDSERLLDHPMGLRNRLDSGQAAEPTEQGEHSGFSPDDNTAANSTSGASCTRQQASSFEMDFSVLFEYDVGLPTEDYGTQCVDDDHQASSLDEVRETENKKLFEASIERDARICIASDTTDSSVSPTASISSTSSDDLYDAVSPATTSNVPFSSSRGLHDVLQNFVSDRSSNSDISTVPAGGFLIGSHQQQQPASPVGPSWTTSPRCLLPAPQDIPAPTYSDSQSLCQRRRPVPFAQIHSPFISNVARAPSSPSEITLDDLRSSTPPPRSSSRRYGGLSSEMKGQFGSASSLDSGLGFTNSL